MWLDGATRWRAGIYSPEIGDRLQRLFEPGPVLDVGCGSGKKVPEPFIPFGVEISAELCARGRRAYADARRPRHSRSGGRGVKQFPDRYFTGILLRSFLEHEAQPRALLANAPACSRPTAPSMCGCRITAA